MLPDRAEILIVDDNAAVREALAVLLADGGFATRQVATLAGLDTAALSDLVILDMNFTRDTTSGAEGLAALERLMQMPDTPPVIMLTAWGTVDTAVTAMRLGAKDYLTKPWDNTRLLASVRTHLQLSAPDSQRHAAFTDIVGRSAALEGALALAARVAPTDATVLLEGASGTGKSLLARAIHAASPRARGPLIEVHVGALPDTLFERELFGHARGAFTDAKASVPGRVALAKGGTLFLDEIGTLGPLQQVKLLRLLQDGVYEPLGSPKSERADVRLIAATNVDLRAEVAAKRFRQDLFYRLAVFPLRMPTLSERAADIAGLAAHFATCANERYRLRVTGLSAAAFDTLSAYSWPGNIRELEHAIARAVIRRGYGLIEPDDLALDDHTPGKLETLERDAVTQALASSAGNLTQAAANLGISRQALYRRLDKFDLPR